MFDPQIFFWAVTAVFMLGALTPFASGKSAAGVHLSLLLGLAGSAYAAAGAAHFLSHPAPAVTVLAAYGLELYLPPLRFEIRIDQLSAYFLLLTGAFSAVVAIYSLVALRAPHFGRQRPRIASGFCLLVWSTLGTVVANDVFSLIFMLEIGTLAFGFLALFKHNQYLDGTLTDTNGVGEGHKNARLATPVYLIVSHTSNVLLLLALLFLASRHADPGLSFDSLRANAASVGGAEASVCFLLALAGLGIRAGLTPAHFWVPLVHPSSPTPTHALSLGIVIKVAVYLMYRFFFQFLTPVPWWGHVVLLLAVLTALVNVWFAIASHDLKTALAYHSVENVGIIAVGLGVALIYGGPAGDPAVATLALVASLYHVLNHAVFKGLLYLCTGAIDNLTRQVVEFEKLGGLIRRYRWTASAFLVGTVSICGFPPFNGFASEWLTLQALLKGTVGRGPGEALVFILCTVVLVMAFVLTAFCFVKVAGITLLGAPRSPAEETQRWAGRDVGWTMRATMLSLAGLCLLLGLFPGPLVGRLLHGVAASILRGGAGAAAASPLPGAAGAALPEVALLSRTVASLAATFFCLGLVALAAALVAGRRKKTLRAAAPWNCGTRYEPQTMQYTGAALSFLVRDQVGIVDEREAAAGRPDYLPAFITVSQGRHYHQAISEFFRRRYNHWIDRVLERSERVGDFIQDGDIRRYLFYIFAVNLAALILFLVTEMFYAR